MVSNFVEDARPRFCRYRKAMNITEVKEHYSPVPFPSLIKYGPNESRLSVCCMADRIQNGTHHKQPRGDKTLPEGLPNAQ